MTHRPDWKLDRLLLRYVDAMEAQDWETFGHIWRQAETDRELEAALRDLHRGLLQEHAGDAGRQEDAEAVRRLLEEHFPPRPEERDDPNGPLTAGEVAGRLRADLASGAVRLSEPDRAANEQLAANAAPLPEQLKQSALDAWRHSLGVEASREYWRQFRQAALRLAMARSHRQIRLAAAREQAPSRKRKENRGE